MSPPLSRRWRVAAAIITAALTVVACGRQEPEKPAVPTLADPAPRTFSADSLFNGVRLFHEHCAQCHGPEAQGHPDWQNPGVAAAPPLNGTGNEWKRRKREMIAIIRNGVKRQGKPVMPAWQGRLSEREIEDIIGWYQALWPAEMHERWREAETLSRRPAG